MLPKKEQPLVCQVDNDKGERMEEEEEKVDGNRKRNGRINRKKTFQQVTLRLKLMLILLILSVLCACVCVFFLLLL